MTAENNTNLKVAPSFPGTCISEYTARGMVRVSPSILPANAMVAPNSPRQRANPRIIPLIIPGIDNGIVMRKKVNNGDIPRVWDADSSLGSTISMAVLIERTIRGNETTIAAIIAATWVNARRMPNH